MAYSSVLQPKSRVYRTHRREAVFFQLLLPSICKLFQGPAKRGTDETVISIFVSEHAVSKSFGLIFGFLLFAQPLITYIMKELDESIPEWKSKLILEL
jgi:hypothetical protein